MTAADGCQRFARGQARCVLIEHRGAVPEVDPSAYIAPTAVLCGAVRVGPGARVTSAALFPGSVAGAGSEVRIGGVVHVNTVLPPGTTVPIGWVAVGDPVRICPPDQHDRIWEFQEPLDFPGTVYGVTRDTPAAERMSRQSTWFAAHLGDRVIDERSH